MRFRLLVALCAVGLTVDALFEEEHPIEMREAVLDRGDRPLERLPLGALSLAERLPLVEGVEPERPQEGDVRPQASSNARNGASSRGKSG